MTFGTTLVRPFIDVQNFLLQNKKEFSISHLVLLFSALYMYLFKIFILVFMQFYEHNEIVNSSSEWLVWYDSRFAAGVACGSTLKPKE